MSGLISRLYKPRVWPLDVERWDVEMTLLGPEAAYASGYNTPP